MARIDPPEPLPELVGLTARDGADAPITIVALAHREELLGPFLGWAAALALNGALSPRAHELLALRTAHNCGSAFEWVEHVRFARAAGLSDDEIDRVAKGPGAAWGEADRLLLQAADELHRHVAIAEPTWSALTVHFATAELVEAVYVVGQYTMLSMVANVATGATSGSSESS